MRNFFKSDALGNNVLLVALSAFIILYGGDPASLGLAGLVMFITEVIKGDREARWTGNVIAYLLSAIVGFFPWLADLVTALEPIADIIFGGGDISFAKLLPLLIPVLNEIIFLGREKPWQEPNEDTPVS